MSCWHLELRSAGKISQESFWELQLRDTMNKSYMAAKHETLGFVNSLLLDFFSDIWLVMPTEQIAY